RVLMAAAGRLDGVEVTVGEAPFARGDRVVVRRGSRRLGVVNGDRGVVEATNPQTGAIAIRLLSGHTAVLERDFLDVAIAGRQPLQHAYALTGHVAQGLTTDRTFVLGTNRLFREWGYVAMSRGRFSNQMYAVVGEPSAREEFAPVSKRRPPLSDLVGR